MKLERVPALSLFATEAFRNHWWIRLLCEEVGDVWITDDPSPGGSFTTFYRVITRRTYGGNAMISDLYYLHELRHLRGFLRRKPIDNWYEWQKAMGHSELDASVTSECIVHFLIPEARAAFTGQEIWVDRHLANPKYQWFKDQADPEQLGVLRALLSEDRLRALATPKHNDFIEWQIHNYGQQNMRWYVIWAKPVGHGPHANVAAWRVVEEHVARPDWVDRHADWLAEVSQNIPGPAGMPFPLQAVEFEQVYKESNRNYGNWPFAT